MSEGEDSRLAATAVIATSRKQSDSDNDRKNCKGHSLSALGTKRCAEQEEHDCTGCAIIRSGFMSDFMDILLILSEISQFIIKRRFSFTKPTGQFEAFYLIFQELGFLISKMG